MLNIIGLIIAIICLIGFLVYLSKTTQDDPLSIAEGLFLGLITLGGYHGWAVIFNILG